MPDEREIANRIERIPAAPGQLLALTEYPVAAGQGETFKALWREFATARSRQDGCLFLRLHVDTNNGLDRPTHFVTCDLWKSRLALIAAIRSLGDQTTYPLSGAAHQTFLQLVDHVGGHSRTGQYAELGQVVTIRHFYTKVGRGGEFESLWGTSARDEIAQPGCIYKLLHRDLNLPTHYISYSLWATRQAPDHAADQHMHYQGEHAPYPLSSPVIRFTLEIITQVT